MTGHILKVLAVASVALTAACDSSEERARAHFEEGAALFAAGDVDRAIVELRNVFRLDGTHKEARRLIAEAEIQRGNAAAGYGQYLRLAEQYPDDVDARRNLTRMALERGDWEQIETHGAKLLEQEPEDPTGRLADVALRYRAAVEEDDGSDELAQVAAEAETLFETMPESALLSELLADHYSREGRREDALTQIDRAIEHSGDPRRLYGMRLALLEQMGDLDAVESTLDEMVDLFPDDMAVPATLIRWYLSQDRVADAETFLRERAEDGGSAAKIDLVRFLVEFRDRQAAIDELDALVDVDVENAVLYRSVRAGLRFEEGERDAAIAELEAIIERAEVEDAQLRQVKVALARMLEETGNNVGARVLVEDVLAVDPAQSDALKMRASWLIEDDEPDEAIRTLRSALEQSPRDPALMTLMARAYERSGNRALMAEMLSLAVEVSNRAPAETLRYARYLVANDNLEVAEQALVDSLRLNAGNPELLQFLGSIHVGQGDWSRARQVADTLTRLDTRETDAAANSLRAQILAAQGRNDEVVGLLEQLVEGGEAGFGAQVAIMRTRIEAGNLDAAREYIDGQLAAAPDEPTLRFLRASLHELQGEAEAAEEILVSLTREEPEAAIVWRALYLLQRRDGREDAAEATLDAALEANPEAAELLWLRASNLQNEGDLEGALEVYAEMYERDSSSPIVANNYASLLTALNDDPESIERAYAAARRLRGIEVPAFQDTYGWIAHLRGEHEEAIEYLEPAAAALREDPSVQYHLGMAYAALGRNDEALDALGRALDLAAEGQPLPEADAARTRLAELENAAN
jgi:tetratricopeptide (TPR) repeat protein